MSSLESRIQRLEEQQPCVCMIGLRYQDDPSINWNGVDYPDKYALNDAFQKSGLEPPLIILTLHMNRHEQAQDQDFTDGVAAGDAEA